MSVEIDEHLAQAIQELSYAADTVLAGSGSPARGYLTTVHSLIEQEKEKEREKERMEEMEKMPEKPKTSRLKRVQITPGFLFEMLKFKSAFLVRKGVPDKAEYRGFLSDPCTGCIDVLIEDESFEEVAEGATIPIFEDLNIQRFPGVNKEIELIEELRKL